MDRTIEEELGVLRDVIKGQISGRLFTKKRRDLDRKLLQTLKKTIHSDEEFIIKSVKDWKAASWEVSVEKTELEAAYREFMFWN